MARPVRPQQVASESRASQAPPVALPRPLGVTKVLQQRIETTFPVSKTTEPSAHARSHQSTTTGEQFGSCRQGKRDSGVKPGTFVEGDGLETWWQQARPRAAKKDRQSRDNDHDGKATRKNQNESNMALAPELAPRLPDSRSRTSSLDPQASTHQSSPTQPSRAAATKRRRCQKLTGCRDSLRPDASHDTRRND